MAKRTTHSDLARCLNDIAERLEKVPSGYLVSDAGTLSCVRDAASALVRQDEQISDLTVTLREAKYGKLRSDEAA